MSFKTRLKGFAEILSFDNYFGLIGHHLFQPDDRLCVYRFSEFQVVMLKSGGDLNGMRACLATDQYKQFFHRMELDKPLRILDLGAHTGGFIFAFLKHGFAIEKSLSVEQNHQTYSRLSFNMALNNLQYRCKVLHAAAWSKSIELLSSEGVGRTSGRVDTASNSSNDRARIVQAYSLNDLIQMLDEREQIDICKVDVEGAEWEIFSHSSSTTLLFQRCRYLIIEVHPSSDHDMDLPSFIEDNGFELLAKCRYGDETFLFRNRKASKDDSITHGLE